MKLMFDLNQDSGNALGVNIKDEYYSASNWFRADEIIRASRLAEQGGFHSVWLNEDVGRDSFAMLSSISSQTQKIGLGTAIVNVYARSPMQIAMGIATLDELSNGRAILGLGVGHDRSVLAGHGIQPHKPWERMREYVTIITKALSGEDFSYLGKFFQPKNSRLNYEIPRRKIPIYLGAGSNKTVQLAGEIADGVLINMSSTKHITDEVIPNLKKGALAAKRNPKDLKVTAILHCYLDADPQHAIDAARRSIARYSRRKSFREMVSNLGFSDDILKVHEAVLGQGESVAFKLVPSELAKELALIGSADDISTRINDFVKAGVNLPVLTIRTWSGGGIKLVEDAIHALSPANSI